jgi:hypothetical protein
MDPVRTHAARSDTKAVGEALGVRGIDRHDETLGLGRVVSLRERIADVVGAGGPHASTDIECVGVERDRNADRIRWWGAVRRLLLGEVRGEARGLPGRVIENTVDDDGPARQRQLLGSGWRTVRCSGVDQR